MTELVRYELVGVPDPQGNRVTWAFGEPDCPLRLATTPTGLGGAPRKNLRQSNARQAGASWRGQTIDYNTIGLDVWVGPLADVGIDDPDGSAILFIHGAWRASLGLGDSLGEFRVHSPAGTRWQYVRLDNTLPDVDPFALQTVGEVNEKPRLGSDQAHWLSAPLEYPFAPADFATAAVENTGDVPTHAVYELTGPGTFTVGLASEYHTLPAITTGRKWVIDTNPDDPSVRDGNGVDVWDQIGVKAWRNRVQPGTNALKLAVTGAGAPTSAKVTVPQQHSRAL